MKDKAVIEAFARRDEQAVSAVIDKYSRLLWPIIGCHTFVMQRAE